MEKKRQAKVEFLTEDFTDSSQKKEYFVGDKSGNNIGNIIASDTFVMFVFVYNERFS